MKKVIFILFVLFIWVQTVFAQAIWDGTANTNWYKASQSEFTITTTQQLAGLATLVNSGSDFANKTIKLGVNINLNDTINWKNWETTIPDRMWVPIGTSSNKFQGTFDGNGFVISGIYINSTSDNQGLFGYLDSIGEIKNIGVMASYVKGGRYYTGGLAGRINIGKINNSYFIGTIVGPNTVGGLVGSNDYGTISNSYFSGTVTGNFFVGGLVGSNIGMVSNSYSIGMATGMESVVGGLVGDNSGVINNSYSASRVIGVESVGGLVGKGGVIVNSYYDIGTSGQSDDGKGEGKSTAEMQSEEFVNNLNFFAGLLSMNAWVYVAGEHASLSDKAAKSNTDSFFASGTGTKANPYVINTKKQLENFSWLVNIGVHFSDKYLKLGQDIILNDTTSWENWENDPPESIWIPIGYGDNNRNWFNGTFDGDNHVISGVYINSESKLLNGLSIFYDEGLFGCIDSEATIKNIGIRASHIKGVSRVGGLAGTNNGTIINSYSIGKITGSSENIGGIAGWNAGRIINSYSFCTVTGWRGIGGLVGGSNGTINNSYTSGIVTGTLSQTGYNGSSVGGFAGRNAGTINSSYSTSTVTGQEVVGGLVGDNSGRSTINNSYSIGAVTGESKIGGLVGYNYASGTINNSYSTSMVSGTSYVGGFAGENWSSPINNCYYDIQTSGRSNGIGRDNNNGKVEGKTTYEMKEKDTFAEWNFVEIWGINGEINDGYPYLHSYYNEDTDGNSSSSSSSGFATPSSSSNGVSPITISKIAKANGMRLIKNGISLQITNKASIEIFNLNGNSIRKIDFVSGIYSVELLDLPKGLYIVKVRFGSSREEFLKVPVR
jgi:hypothetical protein